MARLILILSALAVVDVTLIVSMRSAVNDFLVEPQAMLLCDLSSSPPPAIESGHPDILDSTEPGPVTRCAAFRPRPPPSHPIFAHGVKGNREPFRGDRRRLLTQIHEELRSSQREHLARILR